jgi:fatty acid desaturase
MHNLVAPAALRRQFATAFRPNPWIYWSDLCVSAGIGWGALTIGSTIPLGSPLHLVVTLIAVVALLRAAVFIHELAHLKAQALPGFAVAWHLSVGLPFLLPSLMYVGSHSEHHRQSSFGTVADPEYAPITRWGRVRIGWFIVSVLFVPFLLLARWAVLGPLSYGFSPLRRFLIERGSTLVINPDYRRPLPCGRQAVYWVLQEVAAAIVSWGIVIGGLTGWLSPQWFGQWYVVATGVLVVNQVRTLAAHRYTNDGTPVDATGQLLDSLTLSGHLLPTVFAAPVGLRYHALHHLLPTVPYHSLGTLHRILLSELPEDAPYRQTQRRGILPVVRELLRFSPSRTKELPIGRMAKEV